jgi:DNA-binding transcriptional ArsR family regulator
MNLISLFRAIAVLSLIVVPAISQPGMNGCTCTQMDCQERAAVDCCSESSEGYISQICTCTGLVSSYLWTDYCDPSYFSVGKSISRSSGSSGSRASESSDKSAVLSQGHPIAAAIASASKNAGPPDPDVLEYLPPSAKHVFQVLASDGPLTQKDIISRTDLPPRTVRYALDRLRGEEMIEERFCFQDARQSLYNLPGVLAN